MMNDVGGAAATYNEAMARKKKRDDEYAALQEQG